MNFHSGVFIALLLMVPHFALAEQRVFQPSSKRWIERGVVAINGQSVPPGAVQYSITGNGRVTYYGSDGQSLERRTITNQESSDPIPEVIDMSKYGRVVSRPQSKSETSADQEPSSLKSNSNEKTSVSLEESLGVGIAVPGEPMEVVAAAPTASSRVLGSVSTKVTESREVPKGCEAYRFNTVTSTKSVRIELFRNGEMKPLVQVDGIRSLSCEGNSIAVVARNLQLMSDLVLGHESSQMPQDLRESVGNIYAESGQTLLYVIVGKTLKAIMAPREQAWGELSFGKNPQGVPVLRSGNPGEPTSVIEISLENFEVTSRSESSLSVGNEVAIE